MNILGVDILGIDILGMDILGYDISARTPGECQNRLFFRKAKKERERTGSTCTLCVHFHWNLQVCEDARIIISRTPHTSFTRVPRFMPILITATL